MTFRIIQYNLQYQKALVDLWKKCGLVVPLNDPVEDIKKKLEYQPQLLIIAVLDGRLIGSVMIGYDGHRGWLNYLAVSPEYQMRGYGRKLVQKAIDKLKEFGCLKVNVQVRINNLSAADFYRHLGFKDDEVISLGLRLK
ncbi:MAG: GNAT family acetyltransferase [Candidatus Bathyarchaeota archaeon]|jgi:ribosomal protein S18 acetylase RimI-like enzyme